MNSITIPALAPSNFSFNDWEERLDPKVYSVPTLNERKLPYPPDNYQRGSTSWGKDPKRGQAIINARDRKRLTVNKAFFLSDVLPLIEAELNPLAWKALASYFEQDRSFYRRGGFVRYVLGDKSAWVHPEMEPDKVEKCKAMGATIENS